MPTTEQLVAALSTVVGTEPEVTVCRSRATVDPTAYFLRMRARGCDFSARWMEDNYLSQEQESFFTQYEKQLHEK